MRSMSTAIALEAPPETRTASPDVDIVLPVHNEAHVLAASVGRLHAHLASSFPFSWRITIADNASTDGTWGEAQRLAALLPGVRALHLDAKGRGRALRKAWTESDAAVVAYMDIDLSTDLSALLPLVAPLLSGHSDVTIGSRLAAGARTVRGPRREVISRSYNRLLHLAFRNRFRDAQCGFKAVRTDVARRLLPAVQDEAWFFDTELLLLAEHNGLRITEVPVDWVDDPDSRVHVVSTAREDLKGIVRMSRRFWTGDGTVDLGTLRREPLPPGTGGEIVSFVTVGTVSTAFTLLVFLVLRDPLGALWANVVGLTAAAGFNFAANRRFTFGRTGRRDRVGEWARFGALYLLGLGLTMGALLLAEAVDGGSLGTQLVLVGIASAVSTGIRVALLPGWVFRWRGAS